MRPSTVSPSPSQPGDRLDSWKQIAAYLGRSERTVRRWEENEGLPVHRLQHEKRGSVYAYPKELDGWWESKKSSIEPVSPKPSSPQKQTRRPKLPWIGAVIVIAALVIIVAGRGRFLAPHAVRSIAVMPFDNLSNNAGEEWFSDGMTETLISELSKIRVLKVISRTSVMQYKKTHKPLGQIASELGVDAVIEGSALRVGDRVRITAQLIDASSDRHLWGRDYDRETKDALSLHREVAHAIAQEVGATVAPAGEKRPVSPDAMEAYLKGLYQYNRGEVKQAIDLAREAIRIDSQLAPAHELLGTALDRMAGMHMAPQGQIDHEARAALQRALEIEPDRGGATSVLGALFMAVYECERAESLMRRGFELDPGTGLTYGYLLAARGRYEEAIQAGRRAVQVDPASPLNLTDMGHLYYHARRYPEAIVWFRKALELSPNFFYPHYFIPVTYLLAGQPDPAFEAWMAWLASNRAGNTPGLADYYRQEYRRGGWPAVWRAHLERFPGISDTSGGAVRWRLRAYLFLGEKRQALDELDNLEKLEDGWLYQLEDPLYDLVRQEPRFQALLRRLRYPEAMWR